MTRDEITRWARKAGGADITSHGWTSWVGTQSTEFLERFAALVAAAKEAEFAKRLRTDVHSCHANCQRVTCVAVREAVQAEREACAKVCDSSIHDSHIEGYSGAKHSARRECAAAIRARDNNA